MCTPCWKQVAIKDIWLCMKCMYPSGGTVKLRENSFKNFTQDFIEAVDQIAKPSEQAKQVLWSREDREPFISCRPRSQGQILECHCHYQVKSLENHVVVVQVTRQYSSCGTIKEQRLGNHSKAAAEKGCCYYVRWTPSAWQRSTELPKMIQLEACPQQIKTSISTQRRRRSTPMHRPLDQM